MKLPHIDKKKALIIGGGIALIALFLYLRSRSASGTSSANTATGTEDNSDDGGADNGFNSGSADGGPDGDDSAEAAQEQSDVAGLAGQESTDVGNLQSSLSAEASQESSDIAGVTNQEQSDVSGLSAGISGLTTSQANSQKQITAVMKGEKKADATITKLQKELGKQRKVGGTRSGVRHGKGTASSAVGRRSHTKPTTNAPKHATVQTKTSTHTSAKKPSTAKRR